MPAPNITTGDVLRFRATANLNGQIAVWGCDQRVASVVAGGISVPDLAQLLIAVFDVEVPPTMGATATGGDCIVELLDPATGRVLQSSLGLSADPAGTGGADTVPTQVAAVVAKKTGLAGPGKRGRLFWPFLPASGITPTGELGLALKGDIEAACAAMFSTQTYTVGPSSITTVPVLIKSDPLPHALLLTDISVFEATGKLGTQKRRGDYGKPNLPV